MLGQWSRDVDGWIEDVEAMIDKLGIDWLKDVIVDICYAKSEHLASAWQDQHGSKLWEKQAKEFDKVKIHISFD